ncbi:MAG: ComF family protein [Calditrichales bacterium]|nr:MAG: ComF family protein [Calditrichales bacterium]
MGESFFRSFISNYLLTPLTDVIFPAECHICATGLGPDRKIICSTCWREMPYFQHPTQALIPDRHFSDLYILYEFRETIRLLIHLLKYNHYLTLAEYFAAEIEKRFVFSHIKSIEAIIPVPLYKSRKRERGYNQSEEIARALSQITGIPVTEHLLSRIRPTKTQTRMTREERQINMQNVFECPTYIGPRHVLMIDDVITTGSTIQECARALKSAGCCQVDILALAHPLIGEK